MTKVEPILHSHTTTQAANSTWSNPVQY